MANWITDTTVLSNFANVWRSELLLAASGGALVVCPAVMVELHVGEEIGRVPRCDWAWLQVASLSPAERAMVTRSPASVGQGEAESLIVAEVRALVLLTDDADARRVAKRRGVRVSGTIGVLKVLYETGVLTATEADNLYEGMKRAGFRGPPGALRDFLG